MLKLVPEYQDITSQLKMDLNREPVVKIDVGFFMYFIEQN
jgi:hypothetical protein